MLLNKKFHHRETIRYIILFFRFTCTKAYKNLLNELGDQAGQHELIAENLSTSVVLELASLVKQLKEDRRKVRNTISSSNQFHWFYVWTQRIGLVKIPCGLIEKIYVYMYKKRLRPSQRLCAFKNNGLRMKRRNFRILFYLSFPLRNHVLNTTMCAK